MHNSDNETQSGLKWVDGVLCELVIHCNGDHEYVPIPVVEKDPSFEEFETERKVKDPFEGVGTRTVPSRWDKDATTNVLEKKGSDETTKSVRDSGRMRTVRERADQSCRLEALLVKVFSGKDILNVNGNTALKEVLEELCRIMGEPWSDKKVEL